MQLPPEASQTSPIPEPHLAQLVGLQFYTTIIPLAHSSTIRGYRIVNLTCIFFTVPARQMPLYLLPSLALEDNKETEGEAVQQGVKTAVGSLEPGVLRHDKACCAGLQKIKGLMSERTIITEASF